MGGGGLKAVVYGSLSQPFRHWGMHKKKKKEKTLRFLPLYFSPSEWLEQFIISYVAVLSYLEQWNVDWYIHCILTVWFKRSPLRSTLWVTQPESIFLGSFSHQVLRVECKTWFEIGDRILDQARNRIVKITLVVQNLALQETYCRANLNWFFGGGAPPSAVVLKLNVVLYTVKIQYLLTAFDKV